MKNCALQRAQPFRIFLFVLAVCAGLSAILIMLYDITQPVGWFFAFFTGIILFLERADRRNYELFCAKNECRATEHAIQRCSGRCHHWCEESEDIDLISEENGEDAKEAEELFCHQCGFTHELFGAKSILNCPCPCHRKKKRKKRHVFQCSCHRWCMAKKKI